MTLLTASSAWPLELTTAPARPNGSLRLAVNGETALLSGYELRCAGIILERHSVRRVRVR